MVRIRIYANAGAWVHWCRDGCTLTRGRKFVGADTHIRKCRGVGILVRIRMYANAGAQVRWCGYAYTLTRGRKYANAGAWGR